jgi:hypothetical protein
VNVCLLQAHTTQLTLALDDLTALGAASLLQALSLRAVSALRIIRLEADKCQRERYCRIVIGALCKFPCLEQLHIGYRCLAGGGLVILCSTCPRLKLLDCVIEGGFRSCVNKLAANTISSCQKTYDLT